MKKTRSKIIIALATVLLAAAAALGITAALKKKPLSADAATYTVSSYSDLVSYVDKYSATSSSGQNTIKLGANLTATSTIKIESGSYITIDLNGYNIALGSTTTKAFNVYGNLTLKDSSESYTKSTKQSSLGSDSLTSSSNKYTKTFYVTETDGTYTKYTYTAGSIYGSSSTSTYGSICVYNGGTLDMYGGIIHSGSNDYGAGIYLYGNSSSAATLNMYGGIICDNSASYAGAIYSAYGTMNFVGGAIADNTVTGNGSAVLTKTDTTNSYRFGLNGETSTGSKFDRMIVCGNSAKYGTVWSNSNSTSSGVPFYMYDGAIFSGNTVSNSGAVVYSRGDIYFYGGEVTGNYAQYGNFFVEDGYSMTMTGGTVAYNTGVEKGACFYGFVNNDITMSGGTIENNSGNYGAAGYLKSGCSFKMTGGTIQNNTVSTNGGAFYLTGAEIEVTGGTITGNYAKYGGAFYLADGSTLTASAGTVTDNAATTRGGAVCVSSSSDSASITGGTWTGNLCDESSSYGGTIYNAGGDVTLSGITISGSSASYGGAIYAKDGSMTVKATTIQDNNATTNYGGGIYFYGGSLTLSGKVVIQDNYKKSSTLQNVYIASGLYITLGGALSSGSDIGVTLASSSQTQITTAESSTSYYSAATKYFSLDTGNDTYFITSQTGKYVERMTIEGNVSVKVTMQDGTVTYYDSLGDAVSAAATKSASTYGTVQLLSDVEVSSTISVAEGYYVGLDLNGCTATWTGSSKTDFFTVYGYMSLTDSTAEGGAYASTDEGVTAVAGKNGTQYRTVYPVMFDDGNIYYYYYQSGALTGGQSDYGSSNSNTNSRGGAIYVGSAGTLDMFGGTLTGNTATYGGGVCSLGTFNMYGGSISANSAVNTSTKHNGGGVFIESGSSAGMYGGVLYANTGVGKGFGGGIENRGMLVLDKLPSSDENSKYDFAGLGIVISSNVSDVNGGAIDMYSDGTLVMNDGYLTLNTAAAGYGGAICTEGPVTINGGHITGNYAGKYAGGGVHITGSFTMCGGVVAFNSAVTTGGGVNATSTVEISGGTISHNIAGTEGGGLYSSGKTAISGGEFSYNETSSSSGGGLALYGNTVIDDILVTGNVAGGSNYGGGINVGGGVTLTVNGGYILYNVACYGAGVHTGDKGTTLILNGGEISGNVATSLGGGLYLGNSGTVFYMYGGYVSGNTAGDKGGGIFVNTSCAAYFYGGEISENVTSTSGGGIYINTSVAITVGGDFVIKENTESENTPDNIYLTSGKVIEIEKDFEGEIHILNEANLAVRISSSTFTRDEFLSVKACIFADSEDVKCIGLNSSDYISFFSSHGWEMEVYQDENGDIVTVEYCSQCFEYTVYKAGDENDQCTYEYFVDDGTVYVTVTDTHGNTATVALEGGITVTGSEGTLTWYPDLGSALAAASTASADDGSVTVTLYEECTDDEITVSGNFTLDLNGNTIDSKITVLEGSSLTITDTAGGGEVTGELSADSGSNIYLTGGTYHGENITDLVAEGYYPVYVGKDDDGKPVYAIYSEEEIGEHSAAYIETVDETTGGTSRIYYETVSAAIVAAKEVDTIHLSSDVVEKETLEIGTGASVTIDLNGHTLDATITIDAGSGNGGSLTVVDSSAEEDGTGATGLLTGTITVSGTSAETGETNSYEGTLSVPASAVSAGLDVEVEILTGSGSTVSYSFGAVVDANGDSTGTYGIVTGHTCVYNIPNFYIDENGQLCCHLRCSCGNYLTTCESEGAEEVSFVVPTDKYKTVDNGDGTVTYVVDDFTVTCGDACGDTKTYEVCSGQLTIEPAVQIKYTCCVDGTPVDVSIYLEADNLEKISCILADLASDESNSPIEIVLWTDVEADIYLSSGNYTIDLNGNSLSGSITVGDGDPDCGTADTSLTIKDSASTGDGTLEGTGSAVNSEITVNCDANLSLTGGTYSSEVVGYIDTSESGMVIVYSDDGSTFTFVSEDIAKADAVAKIVDGDGNVVGYYTSLEAAIEAASCGDTITLVNDTDEEVAISSSKTVTIDLNGCTLDGTVSATNGGKVEVTDSGNGTGIVTGTVSGDVEISGGSYLCDVGGYLADGKALYAATDEDGNLIYTVVSDAPEDAVVAVTKEDSEGNEYTIYYDSLDDAVAALEDGDTLTVFKDIGAEDDPVSIVLDNLGEVTIDLNGNTIYGDIEATAGTSLEITDTSGDKTGAVMGAVTGDGDIYTEAGTYSQSVADYLGEGGAMYAYTDTTTGETTYKVLSEGEVPPEGAVVSVTYVNANGETVTVYYDSVKEALSDLKDGSVITLLGDVDASELELLTESDTEINVTLDLNGHTVDGDITAGNNVNLTIVDESGDGAGTVTGGVSADGSGSVEIDGGSYGKDVSEYVDVKGDSVVYVTTDADTGETVYSVVSADDINEENGCEAVASVTYTDADGKNVTLYFETIEDAVSYACGKSERGAENVTITLLGDATASDGLEFASGGVTLDLNGFTLEADIEVKDDASLTIIDSVGGGTIEGEVEESGEGSGSLIIYGGKYSDDVSGYVAEGYVALFDGEYYEVVSEEDALSKAAVKVVSEDGIVTYYENIADALNDLEDGDTVILLTDVSIADDDGVTIDKQNVTFDLNGNKFGGSIVVGGEDATLTITDSVGGGSVTGTASEGEGGTLIIAGGTFSEDVTDYMPSDDDTEYVVVNNGEDGGYTIVKKDDAGLFAEAVVIDSEGYETYYASVADAIAAAENTGYTVVLLSDADAGEITITGSVTIDLNGHTLDADITISADEGGSLLVTDSTGEGSLTGTVKVTGSEDYTYDYNPYEDAFVMDGVRPGADLTVDLSGLGSDDSDYSFGEILDGNGESKEPAEYGIVTEHKHSFNIEVWTVGADGTITLSYVCACGEYLKDAAGTTVVYDADVAITYDEDAGTCVFEATVVLPDGAEATYTVEKTVAAIVEADGVTYYAESLEEAAGIAAGAQSATITLVADCEENVTFKGEVTIDLNGHEVNGTITVGENASVVVEGEGYVDSLVVSEYSDVLLRGGTYGEGSAAAVTNYTDYSSGYTTHVNSDGTVTVTDANTAALGAAASVTDENGVTTYYEDLSAAVDAANELGCCTLTLCEDVDVNTTIEITGTGVTIDLNDHDVYGRVEIADGASATICGDGYVDTVKVSDGEGTSLEITGGTYDDAETLTGYMETGDCAVLVNADGTYTVIGSEDTDGYSSISAVVHVADEDGNTYDVYFENVQAAADFAGTCESGAVVELTKDYGGNITVDSGSVTIDLSGYELSGNVSVGADASVTIEDTVGGGFVEGDLNADGELKVTGGTFADETVNDYVDDSIYTVVTNPADGNGYVTYTVVNADDVENYAAAYVDYGDGNIDYFASFEDALGAALENGGTLGLLDDAEIEGLELDTGLSVELNGHTLGLDVVITAVDENGCAAGALTISDSSSEKTGSVTGSVVVTDASDGWTDTSGDIYAGAFVMKGVAPGADLGTDFTELYTDPDNEEYVYVLGSTGDGKYGIVSSSTHEHSFDIEVWTFDEDGSVTLRLMCTCGNYKTVTDDNGNETEFAETTTNVEITENGDGTVTVKATVTVDGEEYSCEMTVPVAAYVTGENGETYYFETFEEALEYACDNGGTLVLNEDMYCGELVIDGACDVVIDLNGHDMECSVKVEEGSTLTFVDSSDDKSGTISAALDVDGTLALNGVSFTLTESTDEDMTGGIILGDGTTVDLDGNALTNVVGIGEKVTLSGDEGSAIVLGSDVTAGGAVAVDGDITLDLDGCALGVEDDETVITVSGGAQLKILDSDEAGEGGISGTVNVEAGGGLDVYEGTCPVENVTVADNYLIEELTDGNGDVYYEVVSKEEHAMRGHSYEITDVSFDPSTCGLTVTFECFCGETYEVTVHVTEDEYVAEMTEEGITVRVATDLTFTDEYGNVYSYTAEKTVFLPMTLSEEGDMVYVGENDGETVEGWIKTTYVSANCTSTGTDKYTYGNGNGIAVYVETPLTHVGDFTKYTESGITYYYCEACGKYITDINSENGYATAEALLADLGYSAEYSDRRAEALEALEQAYNDAIAYLEENFTDDMTRYDDALASVVATYSVLYDEILSMDYEAQTEAESGGAVKTYYEELIAGLDAAISSAEIELQKKASEELLSATFSDAYAAMEEAGLYDADVFYGMGVDFDALVSEFDAGDYSSVEDVVAAYEEFLERANEIIESAKANAAARAEAKAKTDARTGLLYTGEDASVSGYVESSKGIDGGIELVITKLGTYGYSLGGGPLVYVGEGDLSDDEISALVDGKDVVAVYDVALFNTATYANVFVFDGTYTVRIALPDSLLSREGLQIVFVGDDGTVEVYDTVVTAEGYLQFTTTHFSTFLVLADEEVKDLNRLINVLFIIDCILAALAVVLAIVFAARRRRMRRELDYLEGRKGTKTVASFGAVALLLVIPSYGVGAAVVLGIIGIALLALDIFIIDRIFEKTVATPLVFVDTRKDEYPYSFVYDSSDASAKKSEGTGKSENGKSGGSRLS